MILSRLKARNFRNLVELDLQFHDDLNLVVGDNGQGKTSLLEAIYFLGTTKSFRTTKIASLFAFDAKQLFIEGTCREGEIDRTLSVGLEHAATRRRQLLVNGQPATVREFVTGLPLVAFSSARLEILRGGPDERRRFLDRGIATIHPGYLTDLSRYLRVLRQRNALLQDVARRHRRAEDLEAWDQEWAATALPIVRARRDYAARLRERFLRIVEAYRYPLEQFEMTYRASISGSEDELLGEIRRIRAREISAGFTLRGPHRDDLEMTWKDYMAGEVLSAGETKATVLFLKMAKLGLITETLEHRPVFLLDDVDAELDLGIIERILGDLGRRAQVFATSSKESIFGGMEVGPFRKYRVSDGRVADLGDHDGKRP